MIAFVRSVLSVGLIVAVVGWATTVAEPAWSQTSAKNATTPQLPRFTEEREAAALHFVRKHAPELVSLLDELKKQHPALYLHRIREIFAFTEMLADLQDDPSRYDVELKLWKAEARTQILLTGIAVCRTEAERKPLERQLRESIREQIRLEILALELTAEELSRDLEETKQAIDKARLTFDRTVQERFDRLMERVRKSSKSIP